MPTIGALTDVAFLARPALRRRGAARGRRSAAGARLGGDRHGRAAAADADRAALDDLDLLLALGDLELGDGSTPVALRLFKMVWSGLQRLSQPHTGVLANFGARLLHGQPPLVFETANRSGFRARS